MDTPLRVSESHLKVFTPNPNKRNFNKLRMKTSFKSSQRLDPSLFLNYS